MYMSFFIYIDLSKAHERLLLYGVESWTELSMKNSRHFSRGVINILNVSWVGHVTTHYKVLFKMNKELEVLSNVKSRKLEYLGT